VATVVGSASALDTRETYEPGGVTRFEAAMGSSGIGRDAGQRHLSMTYLVGLGLTDRLSVHLAGSGRYSVDLDDGRDALGFGGLVTLLDTYHLDLDLSLDVASLSGGRLLVGPGFEINLDAHPDQSSFGLFVQGGPDLGGRVLDPDAVLASRGGVAAPGAIGSYCQLAEGHRVLMAIDWTLYPRPRPGRRSLEIGSLRIGYDVTVSDPIVLLGEVGMDLPEGEERTSFGTWLGFQATLP
jgi:hypothetical protein